MAKKTDVSVEPVGQEPVPQPVEIQAEVVSQPVPQPPPQPRPIVKREELINLDEFLSNISNKSIETQKAFAQLMSNNQMQYQRRSNTEWNKLYSAFKCWPSNVKWAEHWNKQLRR